MMSCANGKREIAFPDPLLESAAVLRLFVLLINPDQVAVYLAMEGFTPHSDAAFLVFLNLFELLHKYDCPATERIVRFSVHELPLSPLTKYALAVLLDGIGLCAAVHSFHWWELSNSLDPKRLSFTHIPPNYL